MRIDTTDVHQHTAGLCSVPHHVDSHRCSCRVDYSNESDWLQFGNLVLRHQACSMLQASTTKPSAGTAFWGHASCSACGMMVTCALASHDCW